jgi:hypothetical protein
MSTVLEIESALKQLPLDQAQRLATWLEQYLERQTVLADEAVPASESPLPDYAARRRMIFGEKVLPNMVILSREQERW